MQLRIWPFLMGALVVSCGEPREQPSQPGTDASHGLFLVPDSQRAIANREFRVAIHGGGVLGGETLEGIPDKFDPFSVRVGGYQRNLLEPDVVEGEAVVRVRLPESGNSTIAFSTEPRSVLWGDGEQVLLSQHVKSLFFVSDMELAAPVSSAAMTYRFGLELEIVPLIDPVPLIPGQQLPLQVRYGGPELAEARIDVQRQDLSGDANSEWVFRGETDDAGTIVLDVEKPGRYLATVIHGPLGVGSNRVVHRAVLSFVVGDVK